MSEPLKGKELKEEDKACVDCFFMDKRCPSSLEVEFGTCNFEGKKRHWRPKDWKHDSDGYYHLEEFRSKDGRKWEVKEEVRCIDCKHISCNPDFCMKHGNYNPEPCKDYKFSPIIKTAGEDFCLSCKFRVPNKIWRNDKPCSKAHFGEGIETKIKDIDKHLSDCLHYDNWVAEGPKKDFKRVACRDCKHSRPSEISDDYVKCVIKGGDKYKKYFLRPNCKDFERKDIIEGTCRECDHFVEGKVKCKHGYRIKNDSREGTWREHMIREDCECALYSPKQPKIEGTCRGCSYHLKGTHKKCAECDNWSNWKANDSIEGACRVRKWETIEGTCRECLHYINDDVECKKSLKILSKSWEGTWREYISKKGSNCKKYSPKTRTVEVNESFLEGDVVYKDLGNGVHVTGFGVEVKNKQNQDVKNTKKKEEVNKMDVIDVLKMDVKEEIDKVKKEIKEREKLIRDVYNKREKVIGLIRKDWELFFYRYKGVDYKFNEDIVSFFNFSKKEAKILKKFKIQDPGYPGYCSSNLKYNKDGDFYKYKNTWNEVKGILQTLVDNKEDYRLHQLDAKLCRVDKCYEALEEEAPKICSQCCKELDKDANFCINCGKKCEDEAIEVSINIVKCSKCKTEIEKGANYCSQCGKEVAEK